MKVTKEHQKASTPEQFTEAVCYQVRYLSGEVSMRSNLAEVKFGCGSKIILHILQKLHRLRESRQKAERAKN
jgi:hypothetical protein